MRTCWLAGWPTLPLAAATNQLPRAGSLADSFLDPPPHPDTPRPHPPTHTKKHTNTGAYFYSPRAAIRHYPEWSSFQELYQRTAPTSKPLSDALAGRTAFTYLLPSNDALRPAMQVREQLRKG